MHKKDRTCSIPCAQKASFLKIGHWCANRVTTIEVHGRSTSSPELEFSTVYPVGPDGAQVSEGSIIKWGEGRVGRWASAQFCARMHEVRRIPLHFKCIRARLIHSKMQDGFVILIASSAHRIHTLRRPHTRCVRASLPCQIELRHRVLRECRRFLTARMVGIAIINCSQTVKKGGRKAVGGKGKGLRGKSHSAGLAFKINYVKIALQIKCTLRRVARVCGNFHNYRIVLCKSPL